MAKEWTGERLETFVFNETTIEHLHRYAIAMELAKGKKVLDIACGEGYGSNLLAEKAESVIGVDINKETIFEANKKYNRTNLNFIIGDVRNIPCPDQSFDLVVSFETIEHIEEHQQMMQELKRVLKPGGLIIISTPDKKNYSDETGYKNPFHAKELYEKNFYSLLSSLFKYVQIIFQYPIHGSIISNNEVNTYEIYEGDFKQIRVVEETKNSLYLIALASDSILPSSNNSLFIGNSIFQKALEDQEKMITETITYKAGHALLYPFKMIKKIFK